MTRICAVETIQDPGHPALLWVRIHTDDGSVGLGETSAEPGAVARIVHDMLAGILIGEDAGHVEKLWTRCYRTIAYHGAGGAEMRALSAIDVALWDLLGRRAGLPLHAVLGGVCRDAVPIYNTCGDYGEIRDRERFLNEPAALARELVADGIQIMKIWPFDEFAEDTGGHGIGPESLRRGVARVEAIRGEVGMQIGVAIEGHSLWDAPTAVAIARALEPFGIAWIEDLTWAENPDVLRRLRESTSIPVMASERILTRFAFRSLIERGGADVVMLDLAWTGGVSEVVKIGHIASASLLPLAPHNCGGPVSHVVNLHVCAHLENVMTLETLRAFYRGFFADIVTVVPVPVRGRIRVPDGPGIGVELRADFLQRPDLLRETSTQPHGDSAGRAQRDPWTTARF